MGCICCWDRSSSSCRHTFCLVWYSSPDLECLDFRKAVFLPEVFESQFSFLFYIRFVITAWVVVRKWKGFDLWCGRILQPITVLFKKIIFCVVRKTFCASLLEELQTDFSDVFSKTVMTLENIFIADSFLFFCLKAKSVSDNEHTVPY